MHILQYVEYNKGEVTLFCFSLLTIKTREGKREYTIFMEKKIRMSKSLKFNFNPFKEGLNHVLGTLEKDIMEVLWRRGEASIKDILDTFPDARSISYSTVITVTNRMTKKGLLKKRKMGKAYFYKPIYDREQFFEMVSKKVVEGISGFSLTSAMVHFVDYMSQMEPEKIEYFFKLIESKRQSFSKKHAENIKKT